MRMRLLFSKLPAGCFHHSEFGTQTPFSIQIVLPVSVKSGGKLWSSGRLSAHLFLALRISSILHSRSSNY